MINYKFKANCPDTGSDKKVTITCSDGTLRYVLYWGIKYNYVYIRATVGSFLSPWLASIVGEVSCCQGGLILPDITKETVEHLIGLGITGQSGWLTQSIGENVFTLSSMVLAQNITFDTMEEEDQLTLSPMAMTMWERVFLCEETGTYQVS